MTATTTSPRRRRNLRRAAREFGVDLPESGVCRGHCTPLDYLESWTYDRPPVSAVLGPRGGGKSFVSALATHLDSILHDFHGTRILGGSLSQSQQIHQALKSFGNVPGGAVAFDSLTATSARYVTGSEVAILSASPTSVRGPHVPTLRLDEVDEIDAEIRDAALGMNMAQRGVPAMMAMTSTWHNVGGPMGEIVGRGEAGEYPFWRFCVFDVLERCPEDRSGPALEKCPECPIRPWCHADKDEFGGVPKAKRSAGHYAIDSLIQKARIVSARAFESDYLCLGPKADGLWFPRFDPAIHVGESAEYDPALRVRVGVDSGVHTGAVFWQMDDGPAPAVRVFGEHYAEGLSARANARLIQAEAEARVGRRIDRDRDDGLTDPAGGSRNPVGPTVLSEYADEGLVLRPWDNRPGSVLQGLELLESLLCPAAGPPRLLIHPRCRRTVAAFRAYRRRRRGGSYEDYPEDPQHPAEDLMDALRSPVYTARGRFLSGQKVRVSY